MPAIGLGDAAGAKLAGLCHSPWGMSMNGDSTSRESLVPRKADSRSNLAYRFTPTASNKTCRHSFKFSSRCSRAQYSSAAEATPAERENQGETGRVQT